jgi:hypothetical protein
VEPTPVLRIGDADRRREGRRQSGGDADESLLVEALLDD